MSTGELRGGAGRSTGEPWGRVGVSTGEPRVCGADAFDQGGWDMLSLSHTRCSGSGSV